MSEPTGNEPYPTPSGDDAHPADEPETADDNAAEAVNPNETSDADGSDVGRRPDLAKPSETPEVDPEADAQFRDAVEPG